MMKLLKSFYFCIYRRMCAKPSFYPTELSTADNQRLQHLQTLFHNKNVYCYYY